MVQDKVDKKGFFPSDGLKHKSSPIESSGNNSKGWGLLAFFAVIVGSVVFGDGVSDHVNNANNSYNAKFQRIVPGDTIEGSFKVVSTDSGLSIRSPSVSQKSYLDLIRSAEGFCGTASSLGIKGDLRDITSKMFW